MCVYSHLVEPPQCWLSGQSMVVTPRHAEGQYILTATVLEIAGDGIDASSLCRFRQSGLRQSQNTDVTCALRLRAATLPHNAKAYAQWKQATSSMFRNGNVSCANTPFDENVLIKDLVGDESSIATSNVRPCPVARSTGVCHAWPLLADNEPASAAGGRELFGAQNTSDSRWSAQRLLPASNVTKNSSACWRSLRPLAACRIQPSLHNSLAHIWRDPSVYSIPVDLIEQGCHAATPCVH